MQVSCAIQVRAHNFPFGVEVPSVGEGRPRNIERHELALAQDVSVIGECHHVNV